MEDNSIKHLMVELDCLLDTRLSTISLFGNDIVGSILADNKFHERQVDNYYELTEGKVTNKQFIDAYFDRDVGTLKKAAPTNILKLLHKISHSVGEQTILYPDVELLDVHVNIYPYKLTEGEQEALKTIIGTYLYPQTKVSIVSLKMSQLNPKYIKDEYDCLIIYDFDYWYTEHYMELKDNIMPRNIIFAPALYKDKPPSENELKKLEEEEGITPFELLEKALMPYVNLELLPADSFSLSNN